MYISYYCTRKNGKCMKCCISIVTISRWPSRWELWPANVKSFRSISNMYNVYPILILIQSYHAIFTYEFTRGSPKVTVKCCNTRMCVIWCNCCFWVTMELQHITFSSICAYSLLVQIVLLRLLWLEFIRPSFSKFDNEITFDIYS